jgi:hypothetical protein
MLAMGFYCQREDASRMSDRLYVGRAIARFVWRGFAGGFEKAVFGGHRTFGWTFPAPLRGAVRVRSYPVARSASPPATIGRPAGALEAPRAASPYRKGVEEAPRAASPYRKGIEEARRAASPY